MATRIPFLVFGDGPRIPSGLARIARDLTARLVAEQEELGIRVAQLGIDPPGGLHWQAWDFYGFQETPNGYGRGELAHVCQQLHAVEGKVPVVLAITDPSRLYDITRPSMSREPAPLMELWGYLPIDAENPNGALGGPAAEAVTRMDRVLAYGSYGAGVLQRTLERTPPWRGDHWTEPPLRAKVQHLPHGIEPIFQPGIELAQADPLFQRWMQDQPADTVVIGAVATNQPRKDLALLFDTVQRLRESGDHVSLWLHTDLLTKSWDIGQLAADFGCSRVNVLASTSEEELSDLQLAARYCASDVTIAPGLGEGFGYPIVESLACGTPVVHGNYAGGAGLVPTPRWLVEPWAYRYESCYNLKRPVFRALDVVNAVDRALYDGETPWGSAFCHGSVAHLHWEQLWPRWRSWIQVGLRKRRQQQLVETEAL